MIEPIFAFAESELGSERLIGGLLLPSLCSAIFNASVHIEEEGDVGSVVLGPGVGCVWGSTAKCTFILARSVLYSKMLRRCRNFTGNGI